MKAFLLVVSIFYQLSLLSLFHLLNQLLNQCEHILNCEHIRSFKIKISLQYLLFFNIGLCWCLHLDRYLCSCFHFLIFLSYTETFFFFRGGIFITLNLLLFVLLFDGILNVKPFSFLVAE